jgi:hypothetical protein
MYLHLIYVLSPSLILNSLKVRPYLSFVLKLHHKVILQGKSSIEGNSILKNNGNKSNLKFKLS